MGLTGLDGIPLPLGGGGAVAVPPSDVDVLIEGLPFWLAIDKNTPYQRQTAQYKKDQVDQQPEAGEQSLASWWARSQMSFHFGAGLRYLDTSAQADPVNRGRFRDCRGVDVWTPGRVTRLNGTTLADPISSPARVWARTTIVAGVETLITAHDTTVRACAGGVWTTLNYGSALAVVGFAIDGTSYYALTADGIYKGPISGASNGVKLYTVTAAVTTGCLGWTKDRLMAAINNVVYQLDCNAATGSALPAMTYTHPNTSWQFVAFTSSPSGICVAGYAGLTSTVMEMKLSSVSGGAPVLDSAITLLTTPQGEIINDVSLCMGSMLILATNRGVRISTFASYFGTITLGPNVMLSGDGMQLPALSLASYDRFIFAGTVLDGKPALLRVDLGNIEDQAGHYPWAPDLILPADVPSAGVVTSIAVRQDGTKWMGVSGYGIVSESSAPDPTRAAWLQTSRIRMASVEDKHWAHGVIRGILTPGSPITVETQTPATDWTQAFQAQSNGDRFRLSLPKSEWIALRITLGPTSELNSYLVQALPGGRRQRMLQIPVQLADYMVTRSGVGAGYDGWALERLAALETIESAGAEITINATALFPEAVRGVIEQLTFTQTQDPGDRGTGTGGVLIVQVRTTE